MIFIEANSIDEIIMNVEKSSFSGTVFTISTQTGEDLKIPNQYYEREVRV